MGNVTFKDKFKYIEQEYSTTDIWGNEQTGSIWAFDDKACGEALKSIDDGKVSKIRSIEGERRQSESVGIRKRAIERQRDIDQGRQV